MRPLDQLMLEVYCSGLIRYTTDPAARLQAYSHGYDMFFGRVGAHPQFNLPDESYIRYSRQLVDKLEDQIGADFAGFKNVVEFGCGRGFLIAEIARRLPEAYCVGIDVALEAANLSSTRNLTYRRANILAGDIPSNMADLVITDQVLEHFHADDASSFIEIASRSLRSGGLLFIGTPNRIWGPHDISGTFKLPEAIGFHLKEYDGSEVVALLASHGFRFRNALVMLRERGSILNLRQYSRLERMVAVLPHSTRHFLRAKRVLGWANIRFLFERV